MTEQLSKTYDPAAVERDITAKWDAARAWHADPRETTEHGRPPFSIVIPPPNVTAALHLGHALNNTLQDVLIRFHRMAGDNACWLPGTDHAGIATQTVVDRRLQAEGKKSLKDYKQEEEAFGGGRAKFIEKVQTWKDEYEARITDQLKQMGCSCDWDRQRFTMDDVCGAAVREAFFQLFQDGLIYRGKRLVNWDPVTQTALADDEVEMHDIDGNFWYMKYPLVERSEERGAGNESKASRKTGAERSEAPDHWRETGEYVTVATTRPETMLGDTAVAVNPKDPERARFAGKYVRLPIVNRVIPIIADEYVVIPKADSTDAKEKYASGFLKVTPAHDPNDYEIGQRHDLPMINVMAPEASISKDHGWPAHEWPPESTNPDREQGGSALVSDFAHTLLGMPREDARRAIVQWFKDHDLLEETRPYRHAVGHSYRSHVPVEPYLSDQWYVAVKKPTNRLGDDDSPIDGTDVPQNSLAGAALRAIGGNDHSQTNHDATTSRDRKGAGSAGSPTPTETAYLITFSTYASWLHGDERGSVTKQENLPGTPAHPPQRGLEQSNREAVSDEPVYLEESARITTLAAIQEVCRHRGWRLEAANVRTQHVHLVAVAADPPEKVMNDCKAYATRRMREASLIDREQRVWTRHGSTRYLNDAEAFDAAVAYVVDEQGEDLGGVFDHRKNPLPHGRGSSDQEPAPSRSRLVQDRLTFTPERYEKTFRGWHENIRDWCISRQLWWGHRIPVWSRLGSEPLPTLPEAASVQETEIGHSICLRSDDPSILAELEAAGFERDPDVLDTWFSSALWPMSTMGWPDPGNFLSEIPEGDDLLHAFNPTSVLCTARDIITLWVSRMVMFNAYFLSPSETSRDRKGAGSTAAGENPLPHGRGSLKRGSSGELPLPFHDVYIHPMIQDGAGQRMSKSLGNGVDPMDIIHSHGADAMRFTLASMATQTQDARLPVDCVDPHTGEAFEPETVTLPNGAKVAAPVQERNGRKMVTSYGYSSGKAVPSDAGGDMPLARNTSSKFDLGQRLCNKLWNACRFAFSYLEGAEGSEGRGSEGVQAEDLPSRWILSRLSRTVSQCESAIREYRFSDYASTMYDFFWRDLCDWYIEAVKPTLKDDATQQGVLTACLDATLRMMHPAMPFITERVWETLQQIREDSAIRDVPGVELGDSPNGLLMTAVWPRVEASLADDEAESSFEAIRESLTGLREARNTHKLKPQAKVTVSIRTAGDTAAVIESNRRMFERLGNVEIAAIGGDVEQPAGSAAAMSRDAIVYLHDVIDTNTERQRLSKRMAELEKNIQQLEGRLSNEKYVNKAPAHLVQETRDQLAEAKREAERIDQQLAALA